MPCYQWSCWFFELSIQDDAWTWNFFSLSHTHTYSNFGYLIGMNIKDPYVLLIFVCPLIQLLLVSNTTTRLVWLFFFFAFLRLKELHALHYHSGESWTIKIAICCRTMRVGLFFSQVLIYIYNLRVFGDNFNVHHHFYYVISNTHAAWTWPCGVSKERFGYFNLVILEKVSGVRHDLVAYLKLPSVSDSVPSNWFLIERSMLNSWFSDWLLVDIGWIQLEMPNWLCFLFKYSAFLLVILSL